MTELKLCCSCRCCFELFQDHRRQSQLFRYVTYHKETKNDNNLVSNNFACGICVTQRHLGIAWTMYGSTAFRWSGLFGLKLKQHNGFAAQSTASSGEYFHQFRIRRPLKRIYSRISKIWVVTTDGKIPEW